MRAISLALFPVGILSLVTAVVFALLGRNQTAWVALVVGGAATAVGGWSLNRSKAKQTGEIERSPSGAPIYRHVPRKIPFQLATGESELIDAISEHIATHIGKIETVFHEIISDLVHLDIHFVPATAERNYHVLVTTGMSEAPMTVPDGAESFRFAELVLCLPESWPLTQESFQDERNYWPIRWLKILARMPHEYDTWLGVGHTIPNGDPAEPFSPGTKLSCWMLHPPLLFDNEFSVLELSPGKCIHFYSIVPLYAEEMDFKLKHGTDELVERFDCPIEELQVLNLQRKNFCA